MKRFISLALAVLMIIISPSAFANVETSDKMQEVLLSVKSKILVSKELSEFSGNVSEYSGKISYHFQWTSPDYEKSMSVSCDDMGRITSYHQNTFKRSDKQISKISKAELIKFAESFLRKIVPEAFISESDFLVYDEDSYYAMGSLRYNIGFKRQKDGITVKDNYANVSLCIVEDEIKVLSSDINFDYETEFDEIKTELEDYEAKYKELFPIELIYQDEYKLLAKGNEPKTEPKLTYRIKNNDIGYMDSSSGEILEEDTEEDLYRKEDSMDATVNMGAAGSGSLTPEEMAELKKVEGLLSIEDIEKKVKNLPYVDFLDELNLENSSLYKDNLGKYYYRLNYSFEKDDVYKYFNIKADAKDGEIINLSNNSGIFGETKELSESQKISAEKKITEFLSKVSKEKFSKMQKEESMGNKSIINENYVRMVSNVKYIDNGVRISFDAKNNVVRNYNLNWTEANFESPEKAIKDYDAYEKILEYSPIIQLYIKNDGVYKKVWTLEKRGIAVDAISGEIKNKETKSEYSYSDISGHWAEDAAIKLSEIQVGIPGGKLEPDKKITQEEFLRLLASAISGRHYAEYNTDELYEMLIHDNFIKEEEKAPESQVKREDAFVFTIRMAGFEKVAKLHSIYKVSFSDEAELTEAKTGYAAILSGLGVISGDGKTLRPKDDLTRAEGVTIAYKYLLSL